MSESTLTVSYRTHFAGTGRGWHVVRRNAGADAVRVAGPFTTREQAEARAAELLELHARLEPGTRFDTPFEAGCVVWSRPDADGDFLAHDSDNVLCGFSVAMVTT